MVNSLLTPAVIRSMGFYQSLNHDYLCFQIHLQRNGYKSGFAKSAYSASVYENEPVNTYVTSVNFNGLMAVYTIIEDTTTCLDSFLINPFTGVISTKVIK